MKDKKIRALRFPNLTIQRATIANNNLRHEARTTISAERQHSIYKYHQESGVMVDLLNNPYLCPTLQKEIMGHDLYIINKLFLLKNPNVIPEVFYSGITLTQNSPNKHLVSKLFGDIEYKNPETQAVVKEYLLSISKEIKQ